MQKTSKLQKTHKLTLTQETVRQLRNKELAAVAGGAETVISDCDFNPCPPRHQQ